MADAKESKAARLAANFSGDAQGLPGHIQEAVSEVERMVARQKLLYEASNARGEFTEDEWVHHSANSLFAYRFEEVDGEIVEIRKDSPRGKTKLIHRPELTPPTQVDPFAVDPSTVDALLNAQSEE